MERIWTDFYWINEDVNGSAVAAHLIIKGDEVNEDSLLSLKPLK